MMVLLTRKMVSEKQYTSATVEFLRCYSTICSSVLFDPFTFLALSRCLYNCSCRPLFAISRHLPLFRLDVSHPSKFKYRFWRTKVKQNKFSICSVS